MFDRRAVVGLMAGLSVAAYAGSPDVYVAEGDSITTADGKAAKWPTYPTIYQSTHPTVRVVNIAESSQDSGAWRGRKPESFKGSGRNIMSLLPGNDLAWNYVNSGGSRVTYLDILSRYLDARRASGMKVVLCSTLPRTQAGFNGERAACNAVMASWVGKHCDAYCDFSAHQIGADRSAADPRYFFDGTHPTEAGQRTLASIIGPILDQMRSA